MIVSKKVLFLSLTCFVMDFREYISSLSLDQLREHQNILNSAIVQKQCVPSLPCSTVSVAEKRDLMITSPSMISF